MPRKRNIDPFYLVIKDEDNHIFNVIGPMKSDIEWTEKICELREAGRKVICFTHPVTDSKESIIQMMSRSGEYEYSDRFIGEEPEDTTAMYTGRLPDYARDANRKRVVRVLCKGQCGKERWAEMEVDYPGDDILKSSQVDNFTATCLKCGYIARDHYKWYRN